MKTRSASTAGLFEKLMMTVLLTIGIGPLVGTAIVLLPIIAMLGLPMMVHDSIVTMILLGYVAGGLQAFVCGVAFALFGWQKGELPIWLPIVAALPLAVIFSLIFFGIERGGSGMAGTLAYSLVLHIVPALVTWWLVKAYWQSREP